MAEENDFTVENPRSNNKIDKQVKQEQVFLAVSLGLVADRTEGKKSANKAAINNTFFMVLLLDVPKVYYVSL